MIRQMRLRLRQRLLRRVNRLQPAPPPPVDTYIILTDGPYAGIPFDVRKRQSFWPIDVRAQHRPLGGTSAEDRVNAAFAWFNLKMNLYLALPTPIARLTPPPKIFWIEVRMPADRCTAHHQGERCQWRNPHWPHPHETDSYVWPCDHPLRDAVRQIRASR